MVIFFRFFIFFLVGCWPYACFSLEPMEVLVVANTETRGSVDLARYYMKKRSIPASHLLVVSLTTDETMSRREYDEVLVKSVNASLNELKSSARISTIVLMYGVPLKVAPPLPDLQAREQVEQYRTAQAVLEENDSTAEVQADQKKNEILEKIITLLNTNQRAAVDSELSLVKVADYDLDGWIKNPYYVGFQGKEAIVTKDQVLLVSRLDGPDVKTVRRLIDDTLWAEKKGLQGRAYFDARWQTPKETELLGGYSLYDYSLHKAAKDVEKRMKVVLDEQETLFAENSCPDAAIYCGWYSLAKYIDSFDWQRGAVGFHIASSECSTLRGTESSGWCLKMLEKGVAATIGPVYEPYVQGFPVPHVFFGELLEGYMSLGESYLVSLPYISWQMVLVGDPLYQPFRPL
ncbi:TIGR03790 family protein [Desulforhopalus sp. IMCC35007]|nr:TIGR03790 family protein [Desulforhopalus sp. IMCC35007]